MRVNTVKNLSVVIIGSGRWGSNHARVCKKLAEIGLCDELILCDRDQETLEKIASEHGITEVYSAYPKDVELYLFRTRIPYHWHRFSIKRDSSKSIFYRLFGECYHKPLADPRKEYLIYLESEDDSFLSNKICYWYNRQRDFEWLLPIMDKIVDVDKIPSLTLSQLRATSKKVADSGRDFNILNAEEIVNFSIQ